MTAGAHRRLTGPRLQLPPAGQLRRESFEAETLRPALDSLLHHEDWAAFAVTLEGYRDQREAYEAFLAEERAAREAGVSG